MAGSNANVEGILSRLDDLASRLASDKSVKDLADNIKSMERGLDAKIEAAVASHVKQLMARLTESDEQARKEFKKLRDDVTELVEEIEPGESAETASVMSEVKPLIGELKDIIGWGKALLGEKDIKDVVKERVKGWLRKKVSADEAE